MVLTVYWLIGAPPSFPVAMSDQLTVATAPRIVAVPMTGAAVGAVGVEVVTVLDALDVGLFPLLL